MLTAQILEIKHYGKQNIISELSTFLNFSILNIYELMELQV